MNRGVVSLLVLAVAVLFVFAAGCTDPSEPPVTPTPTQTVTPTGTVPEYDLENPVTVITINKMRTDIYPGEYIECILPSNPSTGYEWIVSESQEQTVTETYIPPTSELAGASGKTRYLLQTQKPGAYRFVANYQRPWENTTLPALSFSQIWMVSDYNDTGEKNPILSIDFDGKVNPAPGEVVKIRIAGNPTTGYEWSAAQGTRLKVLSETYVPDATDGETVGSGGYYEWLCTADDSGIYEFGGQYKRSFEDSPANMFWFDVLYI